MLPLIIIIDDDKIIAEFLRRKLILLGVSNIKIYNSGMQFLKDDNSDASLIFLDYHLGDHSGIDILQKMNNSKNPTKVIMLSSNEDMHIIDEAYSFGVLQYIIKGSTDMHKQIKSIINDFFFEKQAV